MSLIIDGYTYLFYDKYAGTHSFDNPITCSVKLEDLFSGDYIQLMGNDAISDYNKFGNQDVLPSNLDTQLYDIIVFFTTFGNNINNVAKYTVVGVSNKILHDYVINNLPVPNIDFLIKLCKFHNSYSRTGGGFSRFDNLGKIADEIVSTVMAKTGDIIDPIIVDPDFTACQLYEYQKRSIYWMLECEKSEKRLLFNINDEVVIGNIFFDAMKQNFTIEENRKTLQFNGGALIDEVGLGKTIQMTTLSIMNPATSNAYIQKIGDTERLCSRATLVLCPNHLCGQWKRELEKMIKPEKNLVIVPLLTKVHFDKYTYYDVLTADFVIVSYTFFDNKAFLGTWMPQISSNGAYHKGVGTAFNLASVKNIFNKLSDEYVKNPPLAQTNPVIPVIKWHRVIIDEFHEIYTIPKYTYMINILPTIEGKYRWCVTGTPFDKSSDCLIRMLDYVTGYGNTFGNKALVSRDIVNQLKNNFFRRNTKKSVSDEYKLLPIKETVMWLKFSHTERMMYNAYLANPNNDKFSIFLRQLCCHPKLAEETKDMLANCKTLGDIEKMMVQHYKKTMEQSKEHVEYYENRIVISLERIKEIEFRRQKKFLKKLGYAPVIEKKNIETKFLTKNINDINDINDKLDIPVVIDDFDDDDDDEINVKGEKIIINDENQPLILELVGDMLKKEKTPKAIQNINEYIEEIKKRLADAKKDFNGKNTTYEFYKNVFDRLKKTADGQNAKSNGDDNDDNDNDNDDETCGICLGEIPENDIGITKCGHIYCYECIKTIIDERHQCPYCRKSIKPNEVFVISYEKKKAQVDNNILKNKQELINEVGTKLANVIYYLKSTNDHVIIFSQWDDLLKKTGVVLDSFGIKNVFCRGNVWQRDKAIRMFNSDPKMRVIMLSSESAASGTNLTKAKKVIIFDPVCGTHEFRKNTEGQAIGRAHRMGQTSEVEVLRFIIKGTIEEEIYETNKKEDAKHKTNIKIFESSDDTIVLSQDKIDELIVSADTSKAKTKAKETAKANKTTVKNPEKLIVVKGKKATQKKVDPDDSDLDY